MTKIYFFFYSILLLFCIVFAGLGDIDLNTQLIFSLFFIVFIGIPHGAIDHLLVKKEGIKNPIRFYIFYLGLLFLNLLIWLIFPLFGLIGFLIISAYHFGQSQFSSLRSINSFVQRILYFLWGVSILVGLIYYNLDEVNQIILQSDDFSSFLHLPEALFLKWFLYLSSIGTVGLLSLNFAFHRISLEKLMTEVLFFGLIHVCFFLLPILIGFTLYFIVLHSLKVLLEEYTYLQSIKSNLGLKNFIWQLIPYTFLSVLGGGLLFYLNLEGYLFMSGTFILLILISSITLPHSIVMEGFYNHNTTNK